MNINTIGTILFIYINIITQIETVTSNNKDKLVDSVLFTYHGDIQITHRHWSITFNLDVDDIIEAASKLNDDIRYIEIVGSNQC